MTKRTIATKLATFDNTSENRELIKKLRKALNKERYKLRIRARCTNRKRFQRDACNDVRLCDAERLALYVEDTIRNAELIAKYRQQHY